MAVHTMAPAYRGIGGRQGVVGQRLVGGIHVTGLTAPGLRLFAVMVDDLRGTGSSTTRPCKGLDRFDRARTVVQFQKMRIES